MHECMHVCMYACMYVCMHVCMCVSTYVRMCLSYTHSTCHTGRPHSCGFNILVSVSNVAKLEKGKPTQRDLSWRSLKRSPKNGPVLASGGFLKVGDPQTVVFNT